MALKTAAPDRDIHIVAHSMGARVAMTGLKAAEIGVVRRVILLNGADFVGHVAGALEQHARAISLFNVTSRENAVFDALTEVSLAAGWRDRCAVGRGIHADRAVTVRLDNACHLRALRRFGFDLPAPSKRICHWSTYLRPGTGALYRAILEGSLRFATLKRALHASDVPMSAIQIPFRLWGTGHQAVTSYGSTRPHAP